jgi:hypothetical protein
MMEAQRTSETSVDNYFTLQYNPEDNYEQLILYFKRGNIYIYSGSINMWMNGHHNSSLLST